MRYGPASFVSLLKCRSKVVPDSLPSVSRSRHERRITSKYLCLRDFEILGARDVKRDEHERLIFLVGYCSPYAWVCPPV